MSQPAFFTVAMNNLTGIAASGDQGIYYTNDGGLSWTQSSISFGFYTCSIDGSNAVAGNSLLNPPTQDGMGIFISSDAGQNWQQSSIISGYTINNNISITKNQCSYW